MTTRRLHLVFLIGAAVLLLVTLAIGGLWWRSYRVDDYTRIERPSPDYAAPGHFRSHNGLIDYRWPQQYHDAPALAGWEVRYWQLMLVPAGALAVWCYWWFRPRRPAESLDLAQPHP